MEVSRFSFEVPPELIAQRPPGRRGSSRLLLLPAVGATQHCAFSELAALLEPGSLLVVNDTRVRHARLCGHDEADGRAADFLLLEPNELDRLGPARSRWTALVKHPRRLIGHHFRFSEQRRAAVAAASTGPSAPAGAIELQFARPLDEAYFEQYGSVPLPPYIDRAAEAMDSERYQTLFADTAASVAAPTAGLHFDAPLLDRLRAAKVEVSSLTLHVGVGTFVPIRSDRVEDHRMHRERYTIPAVTADLVNAARRQRRPIVAVGTTVVRALESAARAGGVDVGSGVTELFITPGYRFQVVDRLVTNFHTPRSSLLVMVAAFAGRERILTAYREAVDRHYRLFSYGDAMLVDRFE